MKPGYWAKPSTDVIQSKKVILTVKESKGNCPYYKVGDKITFEQPEIAKENSDRLCLFALAKAMAKTL